MKSIVSIVAMTLMSFVAMAQGPQGARPERPERGTPPTDEERIDQVIERIEAFFKSLGLATRLSEKNIGVDVVEEIARRFNERGVRLGEAQNVTGDVAREILMRRL